MPIFKINTLGVDGLWGIWKMEELESELRQSLGAYAYPENFTAIKHPKKRVEWLSSRLLIKSLLETLGIPFSGINNDVFGKPFLQNNDCHISLSHCGIYSVGILHRFKNVGIDIEILKEKLSLVSSKFLSKPELADVAENLKKLCVYWCIKEVVYKLHGTKNISLKNNIMVHPFDFNPLGGVCQASLMLNSQHEVFNIHYICIENYYIAFNQ